MYSNKLWTLQILRIVSDGVHQRTLLLSENIHQEVGMHLHEKRVRKRTRLYVEYTLVSLRTL